MEKMDKKLCACGCGNKVNKTYIRGHANRGSTHSEETKRKLSLANKGKKLSEETKRKIGAYWKDRTRKPLSIEHKNKIRLSKLGVCHTEKTKKRISEKLKNKTYEEIHGVEKAKKLKEQKRVTKIKYVELKRLNNEPLMPTVGRYETEILNHLEKCIGYKIIRQYRTNGYFLDGYCKELKLAVEVDESFHQNQIEKDKNREIIIKDSLRCEFMRIKTEENEIKKIIYGGK